MYSKERSYVQNNTRKQEYLKHFITSQKLDCLAQHPKKPLNQNDTSRCESVNSKSIKDKFEVKTMKLLHFDKQF